MTLRTVHFADDPSLKAVLYGPLVLAGQFPLGVVPASPTKQHGPNMQRENFSAPALAIADKQPHEWLRSDGAMTWRTTNIGQDIVLKPMHASQERYAVYWKTI